MRKETRELLDGLRTIAPTLPGALPFGFVAGIAGANAGLTAPENISRAGPNFPVSRMIDFAQIS